ncbi:TAT-variant-translocated molybdopterin oxidoreductase [Melioribacteraceae bacterium 4301-Me]|uniref:TAT-variant-translocated molybdopterin oxidoreductase n=1 Tax=Pyranulibacter aquaticus TaxID=3163344 RepID=UPI003599DF2D
MKNKNKEFWKSLRDYYDDPKVLELKSNEFASGVTDEFNPSEMNSISRRKFVALLTASAAFAATACSNYRDKGEIIPYNNRPENVLPGTANYYASTCNACPNACGILIKTREGRPIKLDGNPDHPINQGKICAKGQASILNLYDPDRVSDPMILKRKSNWSKIDTEIVQALKTAVADQKEISIIAQPNYSPTLQKLFEDFKKKYPTTKFYFYSLINNLSKVNAWEKCYSTRIMPSIKYDKAKLILSLDNDFLVNEDNFIENMRKYSSNREFVNDVNYTRLYVAEGRMSATGMMADYRLRIKPDQQFEFAMSLLNEFIKKGAGDFNIPSEVLSHLNSFDIFSFAKKNKVDEKKIKHLIDDLFSFKGKAIVVAGNTLPEKVHIVVNLLNELLNAKDIYDYDNPIVDVKQNSLTDFSNLINSINQGKVSVVIHFDTNPVYHLPADLHYQDALKRVSTVITLTEQENETADLSKYVLPINNYLESWGDYYTREGIYSLQQPVIAPIFNTRQKEAVLLNWVSEPINYTDDIYHKYLMNSFKEFVYNRKNTGVNFEAFWYASLQAGFVELTFNINKPNKFNYSVFSDFNYTVTESNDYTVQLGESYFLGDGRFSNNGWLLELPHPVTKVTWDNYAMISPDTAKHLAVGDGDFLEVVVDGRKLKIPAMIQPGCADKFVYIELGYGRTVVGEAGKNVGFNGIVLMSKNFEHSPYLFNNAKVTSAGGNYELVSTQEHHSLDDKFLKDIHLRRKIIREGTVLKYQKEPEFLHKEKVELESITNPVVVYNGLKWAMAIDLNKCTSCSACVASCNVENNIPVVGKDQVAVGREMQWMRIDRYYSGTPDDPIVSTQPMLCQQCDNAPCENVCPVSATNHSPDGLNQMVYNRCVGTRYCLNNCPYKVRRFNFFNFRDHFANAYYENDLTALVNNPEVTVRSRGVMEKCTFCIQRIMEARQNAIKENRELKGSDVQTACQSACPANAIVFGDMNDPNSVVSKYRKHDLAYYVLEELNIKPNVTYIAKLRNTHSEEV